MRACVCVYMVGVCVFILTLVHNINTVCYVTNITID